MYLIIGLDGALYAWIAMRILGLNWIWLLWCGSYIEAAITAATVGAYVSRKPQAVCRMMYAVRGVCYCHQHHMYIVLYCVRFCILVYHCSVLSITTTIRRGRGSNHRIIIRSIMWYYYTYYYYNNVARKKHQHSRTYLLSSLSSSSSYVYCVVLYSVLSPFLSSFCPLYFHRRCSRAQQ